MNRTMLIVPAIFAFTLSASLYAGELPVKVNGAHLQPGMNEIHAYALLAAVAIPFLAVVAMNVYLWSAGERGTLLIPTSGE